MNVIFIEPRFPTNQRFFVRALAEVGAKIIAIGEGSKSSLDDEMRHLLSHYEEVPNVCSEKALLRAVGFIQSKVEVDRMEATVEAHILPCAKVREKAGIPGLSARTAYLCRDKPAMKEVLREAGVPCAASDGVASGDELRAFAETVGYPIIVKPRDGAGASGATRIDDDQGLEAAIEDLHLDHPSVELAAEEFIEGHEGFYDTISIDGEVLHDFASHYYPNVLEAMRTRWISPTFISTNRLDAAEGYQDLKAMGKKVNEALGITTAATHMEWFYGPKGLKFSEIGCRPPGVRAWDLYNVGNDMDLYREWAMAICYKRGSQRPTRRLAAGIVALRPDRDGRIVGYEGIEAIKQRYGHYLIDTHLPPPGTPTQPVEAGYMANAWIRMKHPDYDELRRLLGLVGAHVQVRAR